MADFPGGLPGNCSDSSATAGPGGWRVLSSRAVADRAHLAVRYAARRTGAEVTEGTGAGLRSRGVFISYRRGETSGQARALHELLSQRFGARRVFMDVDSIAPGADFVEKIEEAIQSSGVALVLIGRDWLSRGTNQHLLDDPSDFIRLETDTALRLGVPVIPILVERAQMPSAEELPESLRPLTRRNALELENARWEYDAGRLVRAVEQLVDPTPSPQIKPVRAPRRSRQGVGGGTRRACHRDRARRVPAASPRSRVRFGSPCRCRCFPGSIGRPGARKPVRLQRRT